MRAKQKKNRSRCTEKILEFRWVWVWRTHDQPQFTFDWMCEAKMVGDLGKENQFYLTFWGKSKGHTHTNYKKKTNLLHMSIRLIIQSAGAKGWFTYSHLQCLCFVHQNQLQPSDMRPAHGTPNRRCRSKWENSFLSNPIASALWQCSVWTSPVYTFFFFFLFRSTDFRFSRDWAAGFTFEHRTKCWQFTAKAKRNWRTKCVETCLCYFLFHSAVVYIACLTPAATLH